MHILLVADGRSPITRSWVRMLAGLDCRVSLISTFPCQSCPSVDRLYVLPVAFSSLTGSQVKTGAGEQPSGIRAVVTRFRPALLRLRALAAPLTLTKYRSGYLRIVAELQPDVIHALRIPFEGMLAAAAPLEIPLVLSIWGNDLTFHASTSAALARLTRRALQRADGLLADAARDLRLAGEWGLRAGLPVAVLPGNGGLDLKEISRNIEQKAALPFNLPQDRPVIVNPRGFRPGSVHQDVFFRSLPGVLEAFPDALFVCTAMQAQPQAEKWVVEYRLHDHVLLLPYLEQKQLWQLFARSQVYVSLSSHDGTPNTFLEALACGCFPVVGNIESLREWLEDGSNGLLVDPMNAEDASKAIIKALRDSDLCRRARRFNQDLIKKKAEINDVRNKTDKFYAAVLKQKSG